MNKKKSKVFLRLYSWTEDECLHTKWLRFHSYNKHQINILHVWLVVSVFLWSSRVHSRFVSLGNAQHWFVQDAALDQSQIHVSEAPTWYVHSLNGDVSMRAPKSGLCAGSHRGQSVCGLKVLLKPPPARRSDSEEQTAACGGGGFVARGRSRVCRLLCSVMRQAELGHVPVQAATRTHLWPPPLYGWKHFVLVQRLRRSGGGVLKHAQNLVLAQLAGLPRDGLSRGAEAWVRPAVHGGLWGDRWPLGAVGVPRIKRLI